MIIRIFFMIILMCVSFTSHANRPHLINVDKDYRVRKGDKTVEVKKAGKIIFSFHLELVHELMDYVLISPTEGEKGPFLITVWHKGNTSHAALTFDLSRAATGVASKELLVHNYISAYDIYLPTESNKYLTRLEMTGQRYEIDPRTLGYKEEHITCRWRYKPNTTRLDCVGP